MPVSVGPNYTPDRIAAHGEERLAKFKIPRYIAYVEDRTPSRKIQKNMLIASAANLRADAYDRQDKCWR